MNFVIARNKMMVPLSAATILTFFISSSVFAHKGENHDEPKKNAEAQTPEIDFTKINEKYLSEVKPIFQRSCMNCHSSNTEYPWYYSIPGAKQQIDYDVKESKVHLDMTNDFPFGGHGSHQENLDAILEVVEKEEMPPLRYRMLHWSARIKPDERKVIQNWVNFGINELRKNKKKEE